MTDDAFDLPARPDRLSDAPVAAWHAPITLPTYLPEAPDRYPAYLDRRVYQGSSGQVFPLPFHDRISETRTDHVWQALHLENTYLRVLVLPELGGRIQYAVDKRTGYPLFYANPVIKPALVGLAGPWLAGGVEFNWPQHHRPATFLPTAWTIEEADASVTAWCSDHDPFARMKGMHGIRLAPDSTVIELLVRLFNRSDESQTFLWWANVAAEVHSDYQSFFPDDVTVVADHAKRALSTFPSASGTYYGIDYPARRDLDTRADSPRRVPGDRLDWPRNIPAPTSYMCLDSAGDFFGGYDHRAGAGFVHWADHHYAVGKKQWTWGDDAFGQAWNRNLADDDAAYIELMAGVYTDNQPDFSHLAPGETKQFSQFWYPIAGTGPAAAAGLDAALGVRVESGRSVLVIDATHDLPGSRMVVHGRDTGRLVCDLAVELSPAAPREIVLDTDEPLRATLSRDGRRLLEWTQPADRARAARVPAIQSLGNQPPRPSLGDQPLDGHPQGAGRPSAAFEPPAPEEQTSVEELYLTGRHLEQYRHATRSPDPYWREALRRDPGHAATHAALAAKSYRQARFADAELHARAAIDRLSWLNPNPTEGEPHYLLGLTLVRCGRDDEAYAAFAKASWLDAWAPAAGLQLGILDARHGRDEAALTRIRTALRARGDSLQARALEIVLLRRLGHAAEARARLEAALALDPLDAWTLQLAGRLDATPGAGEAQTLIDVGLENARIGEDAVAVELFGRAREADRGRPLGQTACGVLADYHAAAVLERIGQSEAAAALRARARVADRTWNFASRLDDVQALEQALAADPSDPTAAALLGHWSYAHGRPDLAVERWTASARADPTDPVVWRNLGVSAFNHRHEPAQATAAYERALALAPTDARLWYESDQLLARIGAPSAHRLNRLESAPGVATARDDLAVAYVHLLLTAGRADDALAIFRSRRFQPWEGGEGQVLRAWERTQLALADRALRADDPQRAMEHARAALDTPDTLGEARHPLANPAQLLLTLGDAADAAGAKTEARRCWRDAARRRSDFAEMTPQTYSENTYFAVLAARRLGDDDLAGSLVRGLAAHTVELARTPAVIDYFATSLPALLLFDDDPQRHRDLTVELLSAQLALLAGDEPTALHHLRSVLATDPGHDLALELHRHVQPTGSMS
jgi:tetratricopeptide (TPR) repeat protein